MSRVKPADGTCTDAGKHSSILVGSSQQSIHTQASPNPHHLQRVSPADIDDVCPTDFSFDLLFGNFVSQKQEHVRIALEESAEVFLHALPIPSGIGTRSGDEEEPRMFLVRQTNNLPVNRGGSP